jgi:hypothetical protein
MFLNDILSDENFILPKSFDLCMIRYEGKGSIARGEEEQLDMKIPHGRAREEREACAREEDEVQAGATSGATGRHAGRPGPTPGPTGSHAG